MGSPLKTVANVVGAKSLISSPPRTGKGPISQGLVPKPQKIPKNPKQAIKLATKEASRAFLEGVPQFFPDQTFADFAPETESALSRLGLRGISPVTQAAQGLLTSTLQGDFLPQNNPFLPELFQQAASQLAPVLLSPFQGANRFGATAGNVLGAGLGNLATGLFGGAFEAERQRQNQALALSPIIGGLDVQDLQLMRAVGGEREAQAQRAIDEARARFEFGQREPLDTFLGRIGLLSGSKAALFQPETPQGPSAASKGITGGLGGAATGFAIGGPPGAIIGGLLGGAGGLL